MSVLGYRYGDASSQKVQEALSGVLPSQLVETLGQTGQPSNRPAGRPG